MITNGPLTRHPAHHEFFWRYICQISQKIWSSFSLQQNRRVSSHKWLHRTRNWSVIRHKEHFSQRFVWRYDLLFAWQHPSTKSSVAWQCLLLPFRGCALEVHMHHQRSTIYRIWEDSVSVALQNSSIARYTVPMSMTTRCDSPFTADSPC